MKHTKKMLMVPESEYLTLLSMVKGANTMGTERAETDLSIQKTLNDPKIGEDLRAKRYNWLYKKRRQLKNQIENRPQKVVITNNEMNASVPPYVNTGNPQSSKSHLQPIETTEYDTAADVATPILGKRGRKTRTIPYNQAKTPFKGIIRKDYTNELHTYVRNNREKFRIHEDSQFETHEKGKKIKESDYKRVLDFMLGDVPSPGKGFKFLFSRITKDPIIKKLIERSKVNPLSDSTASSSSDYESTSGSNTPIQSGEGKNKSKVKRRTHVIVRKSAAPMANISAKDQLKNKFLPKIWEKL